MLGKRAFESHTMSTLMHVLAQGTCGESLMYLHTSLSACVAGLGLASNAHHYQLLAFLEESSKQRRSKFHDPRLAAYTIKAETVRPKL